MPLLGCENLIYYPQPHVLLFVGYLVNNLDFVGQILNYCIGFDVLLIKLCFSWFKEILYVLAGVWADRSVNLSFLYSFISYIVEQEAPLERAEL